MVEPGAASNSSRAQLMPCLLSKIPKKFAELEFAHSQKTGRIIDHNGFLFFPTAEALLAHVIQKCEKNLKLKFNAKIE